MENQLSKDCLSGCIHVQTDAPWFYWHCWWLFPVLVFILGCGDSQKKQTFQNNSFRFQFLDTWTEDRGKEDYDPNHIVSIDAPAPAGTIIIVVDRQLDVKKAHSYMVEKYRALFWQPDISVFSEWGQFDGMGTTLHGLDPKSNFLKTQKVFTFTHQSKTFMVIEMYEDAVFPQIKTGFRTIEDSFEFLE